jgi:tRNA (mo5U34)-methyltransferase
MSKLHEPFLPPKNRLLTEVSPCYRHEIQEVLTKADEQLALPAYKPYLEHLQALSGLLAPDPVLKQDGASVYIGKNLRSAPKYDQPSKASPSAIKKETQKTDDIKNRVHNALFDFKPWRKGPFNFHGLELDAEWNSHLKWERLQPYLEGLWGRKVLDVGCNNGYYLLRAAQEDPAWTLGIDPTPRFYLQWKLLTLGMRLPRAEFQMLGIEHLHAFPNVFDTVLCMGIVYHHPDPMGQIKALRRCTRPGGTLVLEAMGIESQQPICLFPEVRYAKAPGVWFLPSATCMQNWLWRAGFKEVEIVDSRKTTHKEQRNSSYCPRPFETLKDFLDPDDPEKTVEGYPAPWRHMLIAR